MRTYDEINVDMAAVRGRLLVNGRDSAAYPASTTLRSVEISMANVAATDRLNALRAEMLAVAQAELEQRRINRPEGS